MLRFFRANVSVALTNTATDFAPLSGPVQVRAVGDQNRMAGEVAEFREHLRSVGKLGHPFRRHKAGRLHDWQASLSKLLIERTFTCVGTSVASA